MTVQHHRQGQAYQVLVMIGGNLPGGVQHTIPTQQQRPYHPRRERLMEVFFRAQHLPGGKSRNVMHDGIDQITGKISQQLFVIQNRAPGL